MRSSFCFRFTWGQLSESDWLPPVFFTTALKQKESWAIEESSCFIESLEQKGSISPPSDGKNHAETSICFQVAWGLMFESTFSPHLKKQQHFPRFFTRLLKLGAPTSRRFCDLRLRCPSRTPEIASDLQDKRKQCCIAIKGCDGKSLAICDF